MRSTSSTDMVWRHMFTVVIHPVFVLNRIFNATPTERLQHCTGFTPTGLTRTELTFKDLVIKKTERFWNINASYHFAYCKDWGSADQNNAINAKWNKEITWFADTLQTHWLYQLSNQAHFSNNLLHFDFYQKYFGCDFIHMLNTENDAFYMSDFRTKYSRNRLMRVHVTILRHILNQTSG